MTALSPLLARLLLRYVGNIMLGAAGATALINDPDLVNLTAMAIGAALNAVAETWMIAERKNEASK